jgi:septum formation protein
MIVSAEPDRAQMPALVLASKSASRRAMLESAGVPFRSEPAEIDERAVEADLAGAAPGEIALALARAKALALRAPGEIVLGSDSLVVAGGRRFDKPATRAEAAEHLRNFSGRTMELHSAAALARDGRIVWDHVSSARLAVRKLASEFIESYLDAEWPAVAGCVGVFRIEGPGVQLFESIEGDYFTVLGMPLLSVLGALRSMAEQCR